MMQILYKDCLSWKSHCKCTATQIFPSPLVWGLTPSVPGASRRPYLAMMETAWQSDILLGRLMRTSHLQLHSQASCLKTVHTGHICLCACLILCECAWVGVCVSTKWFMNAENNTDVALVCLYWKYACGKATFGSESGGQCCTEVRSAKEKATASYKSHRPT